MSKVYDTLSMLSLKCAANIFDLSSGLVHVSIRDQVVRARLLIKDLCASDAAPKSLIIVGAGVAGVTAAIEAARANVRVVLLEVNSEPFELQACAPDRYIGPYMYEWPACFYEPQNFPPSDWRLGTGMPWRHFPNEMGWESARPISGKAFAEMQRNWLRSVLSNWPPSGIKPDFLVNVSRNVAKKLVFRFLENGERCFPVSGDDWYNRGKSTTLMANADYIILAASMGKENVSLKNDGVERGGAVISGQPFWSEDQLAASGPSRIGIFGGGDGALQDFLRVMTNFAHPLEFLDCLYAEHKVAKRIESFHEQLLAFEYQCRLQATWDRTTAPHLELDRNCRRIAGTLARDFYVCRAVAAQLRPQIDGVDADKCPLDNVCFFVRDKGFSKAYLLNRFLVHLIDCCRDEAPDQFADRRNFEVLFERTAVPHGSTSRPYQVVVTDHRTGYGLQETIYQLDRIAVRFGIDSDDVPAYKMLTMTNDTQATRTTLAQIPLPWY